MKHFTGLASVKAEKHKEAIETFTLALQADQSNENYVAQMFYNRGFSYEKIGNPDKAFAEFSEALRINEAFGEALYRRANIHFNKREYADCIVDCKAAKTHREAKKLLDMAEKSLKATPKRSCYEILGIRNSASSGEIKKTYRKLSLQFHPDKAASDATALEKSKMSQKFRDVKEAHDTAMARCK